MEHIFSIIASVIGFIAFITLVTTPFLIIIGALVGLYNYEKESIEYNNNRLHK